LCILHIAARTSLSICLSLFDSEEVSEPILG
jgi:hypothetical protein